MRKFAALCLILMFLISCKENQEEKAVQKKEETPEMVEPLNPEMPEHPTMIKALKDAKEVKKQIDARRVEDNQVLKEQN